MIYMEESVKSTDDLSEALKESEKIKVLLAQALFGKLKRNPGTGAGLKEKVYNGFPPQCRNFLNFPGRNFLKFGSCIKNKLNFLSFKIIQAQQIFACPLKRTHKTILLLIMHGAFSRLLRKPRQHLLLH